MKSIVPLAVAGLEVMSQTTYSEIWGFKSNAIPNWAIATFQVPSIEQSLGKLKMNDLEPFLVKSFGQLELNVNFRQEQ